MLHSQFSRRICTAGWLAFSMCIFGASTFTRDIDFVPVGLAPTETAQINVANIAGNSSSGTAASCSGTISFLDASGNTIGTATSFTVTSGQAFSASLPHSSTGASGRTLIRGLIQLTFSTSSQAPCALTGSLETFDTASGVTHAFLEAKAASPGGPEQFGH